MKTVVITGATSGIGFATARRLLRGGYRVIGVGRSKENIQSAEERLEMEFERKNFVFFQADLINQREVRRAGAEIGEYLDKECGGMLYALVNNAGCVRSWYATSEDGVEQQFALNHIAGFLLSRLLLPHLIKARGRILFTSSASHRGMDVHWKDLMYKRRYHPLLAYKQSKLCNVLTALWLNRKFGESGITAACVDPGLVKTEIGLKKTVGIVNFVWRLRMKQGLDPSVPAETYAWLLDSPAPPDRLYYFKCAPARHSAFVTAGRAERLAQVTSRLCDLAEEKL